MENLPFQVLERIFSYLGIKDRLRCSLVCKRWHIVTSYPRFLNGLCVTIDDISSNIVRLTFLTRNFSCFKFTNIRIHIGWLAILKLLRSQIRCITFEDCVVEESLFNKDALNYPNLQIFKCNCEAWRLFQDLPNLIELHLFQGATVSDHSLRKLANSMPNLKVLTLGCEITFDVGVLRALYPDGTFRGNLSPFILSFPVIIGVIRERARTIKELAFTNTRLSSPYLVRLSKIKHLKLKKITLSGHSYSVGVITMLCKNQPNLKSLNLSSLHGLKDDILQTICVLLPDIEEFIVGSSCITSVGLKQIFQLPKLKKLSLMECISILPDEFEEATRDFRSREIKSLSLNKCKICRGIAFLIPVCTQLLHLDLGFCSVTDIHVMMISQKLTNLQCLKLKACTKITDVGITGNYNGLNSSTIPQENCQSLSNLKQLRKLDLSGCHEITESGVINAIKLPNLRVLFLRDCRNITASAIRTLELQNPSIENIYWSEPIPQGEGEAAECKLRKFLQLLR